MSEFEDSFGPQPEPFPGVAGIPPRPPKKTARGLADGPPPGRGSILDEIERRLARYPEARVKRDASSISCFPTHPDGFAVRLEVTRRKGFEHYHIFYKGSRVETSSRKKAVVEFGFGLSNGCRVKEYSRNGWAYRWIVELWDIEKQRWEQEQEYIPWSNALWKFWRPPNIRYLQNRLIDLDGGDLSAAA